MATEMEQSETGGAKPAADHTARSSSLQPPASRLRHLFNTLELIKFSHTVFALPFALMAMLVAAHGLPTWRVALLILLCMVSARTAAMAFNRWADWELDKSNPRTARRSTLTTRPAAAALCLLALAFFFAGAIAINPLCGWLSPVAALLVLGYSLMKRFTAFTHAFLGFALSAAPMGAWAAVTGSLATPIPWCLAAAVWCWVFGFDLIYATQDIDHDRSNKLLSFPARFGIDAAIALARLLHVFTFLLLVGFGFLAALSVPYWISLAIVAGALIYEHLLSRTGQLDKINLAFFQMNGLVGIALLTGVALDVWTHY